MKILVVGPSWIGDTVLAQPLLQAAARAPRRRSRSTCSRRPGRCRSSRACPRCGARSRVPSATASCSSAQQRRTRRASSRAKATTRRSCCPTPSSPRSFRWLARHPACAPATSASCAGALLNDVRRLDENALPQIAQRYAALALDRAAKRCRCRPLPAPGLRVDEAQRARDARAARPRPPAARPRRCARARNTGRPSAGRRAISRSSRSGSPRRATRSG